MSSSAAPQPSSPNTAATPQSSPSSITSNSSIPTSPSSSTTQETTNNNEQQQSIRLSNSTRFRGYLTFILASVVNYNAADISDGEVEYKVVKPVTTSSSRYAMAVSLITFVLCVVVLMLHLDRCTRLRFVWQKAFAPKSKIELSILLFLVIWWGIATWILTSVRGIAGDGQGQFNLYFSTWVCCITSFWTIERWWVAAGLTSFQKFMTFWPNRAPGWMALLLCALLDLIFILDLRENWEEAAEEHGATKLYRVFLNISYAQWTFAIFVTVTTCLVSFGFLLLEVFRNTSSSSSGSTSNGTANSSNETTHHHNQSDFQIILEGSLLLFLVICWIPFVTIATTPGGMASFIGNTYFFTWGSTIFVIQTFVWWIRDWRKGVWNVMEHQRSEYEKALRMIWREKIRREREEYENELREVDGGDKREGVDSTFEI